MSVKIWLGAMLAGTALVVLAGARPDVEPMPEAPYRPPEAPWLTREAAAQVIGPGGGLGPLFQDVELGGPAPLPRVRARIAEFARANNVAIDLEIVDGVLAAVRFDVMFGGCCGYEAVDVLALRLHRPTDGGGCVGGPERWIDDWSFRAEPAVRGRARVRGNRLAVRWERAMKLAELLARADRLLGADPVAVAEKARDRWTEIEPGRRYLHEMPYGLFARTPWFVSPPRDDPGIVVAVARDRITEVSFSIGIDPYEDMMAALRSRWDRPRIRDQTWTWRRSDRIVTAEIDESTLITIRSR